MNTTRNSLMSALRGVLAQRRLSRLAQRASLESLLLETDRAMMDAPMTGSHDHNFAALLIPHRYGAIAMAQAELRYGTDPVLRRLAQEMIIAHEREIRILRKQIIETEEMLAAVTRDRPSTRRVSYGFEQDH